MLKSRPLVDLIMGGTPEMVTSEWTTPGPSMPETQLVPAAGTLLTQWIVSFGVELKLAASKLPVIERLAGLMAAASVFIAMSHKLNGSILATFTRKKIVVPLATFGRLVVLLWTRFA